MNRRRVRCHWGPVIFPIVNLDWGGIDQRRAKILWAPLIDHMGILHEPLGLQEETVADPY